MATIMLKRACALVVTIPLAFSALAVAPTPAANASGPMVTVRLRQAVKNLPVAA